MSCFVAFTTDRYSITSEKKLLCKLWIKAQHSAINKKVTLHSKVLVSVLRYGCSKCLETFKKHKTVSRNSDCSPRVCSFWQKSRKKLSLKCTCIAQQFSCSWFCWSFFNALPLGKGAEGKKWNHGGAVSSPNASEVETWYSKQKNLYP